MKKVVMILICLAFCAFAQWNNDPESTGTILLPGSSASFFTATSDGQNGVVAVSMTSETLPSGKIKRELIAQRIDDEGNRVWGTSGVVVYSDSIHSIRHPDIQKTTDGKYILIWVSAFENVYVSGDVERIFGLKLTEYGVIDWGPVEIVPYSELTWEATSDERLVADNSGGAYIGTRHGPETSPQIKVYHITSTGSVNWNTVVRTGTSSNMVWFQRIINDGLGDAIIMWADARSGTEDIYVQKVNYSGATQWTSSGVKVNNLTTNIPSWDISWELGADGSGGAVALWCVSDSTNLWGQRITSTGTLGWGANEKKLGRTGCEDPDLYAICDASASRVIATWADYERSELIIQSINVATGSLNWGTNGSVLRSSNLCSSPKVIKIDSDYCFLWVDRAVAGVTCSILAQKVNSSGATIWSSPASINTNPDDNTTMSRSYGQNETLFQSDANSIIAIWESSIHNSACSKVQSDGTLAGESGPGDPDLSFEFVIDDTIVLGGRTPVTLKFKNNGGDSEPVDYHAYWYGGISPDGPWTLVANTAISVPSTAYEDSSLIPDSIAWGGHGYCILSDPPVFRTNYIKVELREWSSLGLEWSDSIGAHTVWSDDLHSDMVFWCFDMLLLALGPEYVTPEVLATWDVYKTSRDVIYDLESDDEAGAGIEFGEIISHISGTTGAAAVVLVNLVTTGSCFWNFVYGMYLDRDPWRIFDFLGAIWDFITGGSREISYYSAGLATVEASRTSDPVRTLMMGNETVPSYGWYMDFEVWTGPDSCIFVDWVDSLGNNKRLILGNEKSFVYIITEGSSANLSIWGDAGAGAECVLDTNISSSTTDTIPFGAPVGIKNREPKKPNSLFVEITPNPFNSSVSISAPEGAKVEIFDIEGKKVGELPGGETIWKPEPSMGSGIYLIRATVGEQEVTKRVVYLK
jgi:hypothetical protein